MMDAALENGGRDNITIIVLDVAVRSSADAHPTRSRRATPPQPEPGAPSTGSDARRRRRDRTDFAGRVHSAFAPAPRSSRPPPGVRSCRAAARASSGMEPALAARPCRSSRPSCPVLGAVALWLVTGSMLSLWLAALGPLIAGATLLDGARGARRDRRRAEEKARVARERVGRRDRRAHADERARRWARHPDVAAYVAHDGEIWRPVPGRADVLVLGSGAGCERRARDGGRRRCGIRRDPRPRGAARGRADRGSRDSGNRSDRQSGARGSGRARARAAAGHDAAARRAADRRAASGRERVGRASAARRGSRGPSARDSGHRATRSPAPRTSRSCASTPRRAGPPRCGVVLTVRSPGEASLDARRRGARDRRGGARQRAGTSARARSSRRARPAWMAASDSLEPVALAPLAERRARRDAPGALPP